MEFRFRQDKKTVQLLDPDTVSVKMNAWPDCYYNEMEPAVRRQLLDAAERLHLTPEDNKIREFLFEKRYLPNKASKNSYIDVYLRPWMEFKFLSGSEGSGFGRKRNQKRIRQLFEEMGEPQIREMGSWASVLLSREYEHSGMCYISLSSEDPAYRSVLFGLGSVSDEKLYSRIYGDVYLASTVVPERFEMQEELALWSEAVKRALRKVYPHSDL